MYNEIFDYLSPHLTQWQHGFLPGRSTVSQLSQVVHQFSKALEMRQQVDIIYLDFSKAFDRVPHEKLLCKLEYLNICVTKLSRYLFSARSVSECVMFVSECSGMFLVCEVISLCYLSPCLISIHPSGL